MSFNNRSRLWAAAFILCGPWFAPGCIDAQWVMEKATQKWVGGETVELYLPRQAVQEEAYVYTVLFDGQSIPFEVVRPKTALEAARVRVVVAAEIAPGVHEISVQFTDTALQPVPKVNGLTLEEARRQVASSGLSINSGASNVGPSNIVNRQTPAAGTRVPPGTRISVEIATRVPALDSSNPTTEEPAPTEAEPSWLWAWLLALAVFLSALTLQRMRSRQSAAQTKFRFEAHNDLDHLRKATTPPIWQGDELRLDLRLVGHMDPGQQTIAFDDPINKESR